MPKTSHYCWLVIYGIAPVRDHANDPIAECSATPYQVSGHWGQHDSTGYGDRYTQYVHHRERSLRQLTRSKVLSIPVWLLWRVRIKSSRKCGLAAFLCLSICIIMMAIVRVSGLHNSGKFDIAWISMWQQVEACVVVTMLLLTSFRSLCVAPNSSACKARPWVPSTKRLLGKRKGAGASNRRLQNLTIPSVTLTGLCGFVQGNMATMSTQESFASDLATIHLEPARISWRRLRSMLGDFSVLDEANETSSDAVFPVLFPFHRRGGLN